LNGTTFSSLIAQPRIRRGSAREAALRSRVR
jgi:hypothetical protein